MDHLQKFNLFILTFLCNCFGLLLLLLLLVVVVVVVMVVVVVVVVVIGGGVIFLDSKLNFLNHMNYICTF
jgi:hypothetical protein